MPNKRSAEEKLEYYRRKIRKYEIRQDAIQQINDSPDHDDQPEDWVEVETVDPEAQSESDFSDETTTTLTTGQPMDQTLTDVQSPPETEEVSTGVTIPTQPQETQCHEDPAPILAPELLQALGEATEGAPEFGEKIHEKLAQLWTPLLKKGLTKENKEKVTKEYLIPENCKLLQAPKLNPEITAALSELGRNRDKKMASSQQQLGVGITAINRAMTILLNTDDKIKAIKCLSDGCRILCDLHYLESHYRTKLITPGLDKSFCQVIQDVERDETLFGTKLSEKIKASTAITRQGNQIKKPYNNPKPSTSQATAGRPAPVSGNWSGHARSSNRGGRGGSRRGGPGAHSAPRAPPTAPPAQTSLPLNNRPRGPPQQQRR